MGQIRQMTKSRITQSVLCLALTLLLVGAGAGRSDEVADFTKVGSSPPAKVAEVKAVTNQRGFVEAYSKIASTIAREAYAMDKQDWTLLAAQYTDDACFETRPGRAMNVKSAVFEFGFVRSAAFVGLGRHLIRAEEHRPWHFSPG